MKKLVGIYKCRHCGSFVEISTKEGLIEDKNFHEPFDVNVFSLKADVVTTWAIKKNGYSEFKILILNHCNNCSSSVALFDLTKFALKESE